MNRAREGWDVHFLYRTASGTDALTPEKVVLADTEPCHLIVSPAGCASVAGLEKGATMDLMVALILYIMGKQVERVQHQYNWPKGNGR